MWLPTVKPSKSWNSLRYSSDVCYHIFCNNKKRTPWVEGEEQEKAQLINVAFAAARRVFVNRTKCVSVFCFVFFLLEALKNFSDCLDRGGNDSQFVQQETKNEDAQSSAAKHVSRTSQS